MIFLNMLVDGEIKEKSFFFNYLSILRGVDPKEALR